MVVVHNAEATSEPRILNRNHSVSATSLAIDCLRMLKPCCRSETVSASEAYVSHYYTAVYRSLGCLLLLQLRQLLEDGVMIKQIN